MMSLHPTRCIRSKSPRSLYEDKTLRVTSEMLSQLSIPKAVSKQFGELQVSESFGLHGVDDMDDVEGTTWTFLIQR